MPAKDYLNGRYGAVPVFKEFEYVWGNIDEAAEGPTEESYFAGVKNNRRELDIGSDVHIEVIPKAEGEESL